MKTTNFSNQLRGEGESENLITIISVIQSMYYICLQKFPSSTRLRILYSLYLLDITKSKQQAIQELNNAQLEIPALDEQFIIFRYQTIIENELITGNGKNQKGEQNESVNELSIQNYLQACRQNIEKSASMHTEFWSQLQDQTPDLGKLSELGFKINIINSRVEDYYNKLIQLTYCMPAIQRYYAKFLIQILHDKEKGNQILEKMFFSNAKGNLNMIDMENEPRPTIFMSAEDDSFCQIKNANLAAGCALGYSKIEIINRNIKVIMPHLYAQYHNSFIYNYLNTLEPQILGIERYLPAKTKQDYLLPINVNVRNVPSLIHGLQFSGQFFIDKHLNITCHMIIDTEGLLLNISSSSLPILDINVKKVEKNKYQVDEIIPGFFEKLGDEKEGLLSKHGLKVDCFNLKIRKKPKPFNASVSVIKINFRQVNLQGYLVKIQKTKDLFTLEEEQKMHIHNSTIKKHLFLNYNRETGEYYGQIENGPPSRGHSHLNTSNVQDLSATRLNSDVDRSKINDKSIIKDSKGMTTNNNITIRKQQNLVQSQNTPINNNHIQVSQKFSNSDQENMDRVLDEDGNEILVPQFKNWGEKIRTVRFINGKQYDIEDLKREEEDVVEQLQQEEIQNMENQGIDKFGNQVEDEKQGFQVQKLFKKKTVFVKFIKESKYLKVKSMINLRYYSACVVFTMCVLALINYFVIVNILNQSSERYNLVSLSYRQISNSQSILSNILQIYAENKYKDPSSYDNTLISQAKKSIRFALNDLEDIQNYLQANTLSINEDHKQLLQENIVPMRFKLDSEYGYELYNLNEATQQIITKVNSLEILTLFLDIPQKKIKTFFKRCEEFSKSAQQGNEEEINSDEKLFNLSDDEDNKLLNHGRNKGKINHKNGKVFFIPFLICAIVFLVYFVLSYILSKNLSNKYYIFVKEYNYTNTAEGFMGFSNNALRQLLIDENFTVLNGTQLQNYVEDSVLNMYSIMSGIQSEYTENLKYHYTEYIDAFQNVMIKDRDTNTCDILVNRKNVSQTICEQFMDNAMLQGFSIALARHFENFRILQSQFEYEKSIDPSYANNGTLFYQSIVTQMYEMQEDYISNLFRYLIEQFQSSLEVLQTNSNGAKVTILICCIILIIFIYLILWVPLISNINVEIVRIRSMITMIPLDVCASTPSIRIILGKYITNDFEK
ncbi:PAS domain [Pseudocohnilembus persalinus]|uniref:PAS domain n=1 Tax=Pseudocohnilembus persalinus TaxID=266149 RepID=A0A0V0QSF7_PSEPJ|nr:PAS domain [Pseudocohnilembus persalinus]|eukprot:KRX05234.1 PAS domain [Pseudocohnilembus persalinus]